MATTTPLNGWPVPTSTDYVKDGATSIEALGDAIDTSVGEGLLAWKSWAPTLSGGWANGNGVWSAKYAQIGKIVIANGFFTLGSTTTKGTILQVSLPVNAKDTLPIAGTGTMNVAGSSTFIANVAIQSVSTFRINALNAAGTYANAVSVTATVPATWVTSDTFRFQITYEAD